MEKRKIPYWLISRRVMLILVVLVFVGVVVLSEIGSGCLQ